MVSQPAHTDHAGPAFSYHDYFPVFREKICTSLLTTVSLSLSIRLFSPILGHYLFDPNIHTQPLLLWYDCTMVPDISPYANEQLTLML